MREVEEELSRLRSSTARRDPDIMSEVLLVESNKEGNQIKCDVIGIDRKISPISTTLAAAMI